MTDRTHIDEHTSENTLFRLTNEGNKKAFTIIYKKYHKMLYLLAFRYLKDRSQAEGTVQQVFTKLWERHSEIMISLSLRNYLYTMTKNAVLNQIRNKNNALTRNYEAYQTTDIHEDNLLSVIEEKELSEIFYRAIDMLPGQKKTVCLLKLGGKISNQEIAQEMGISIHTVKTHYAQAIRLLRSYIAKMLIMVISIILF